MIINNVETYYCNKILLFNENINGLFKKNAYLNKHETTMEFDYKIVQNLSNAK